MPNQRLRIGYGITRMLCWEEFGHVRIILQPYLFKSDLMLGVIFNWRPLTIDLRDANAYANNEVKKLAHCRCCTHVSNRKWSRGKLFSSPLLTIFGPFAVGNRCKYMVLMLNETNACVRQIDGLLFLDEQAAGSNLHLCQYSLKSALKHRTKASWLSITFESILFNSNLFSLSLTLSLFLALSLSLTRREWRLRTMSISTWRWRGRMALWCSLKSSGTLHSANWWKPTVNGRWDHNTIVNSVFAPFVLVVMNRPCYGHLFWWSTSHNKQVFFFLLGPKTCKHKSHSIVIVHPLIVSVTYLSIWVLPQRAKKKKKRPVTAELPGKFSFWQWDPFKTVNLNEMGLLI